MEMVEEPPRSVWPSFAAGVVKVRNVLGASGSPWHSEDMGHHS